jgi:hypothetical protein
MAFKITKLCRQQSEVIQNHDNENVRNVGQGETRHRKYKRLKLGGGQKYDRSSDYTAIVAEARPVFREGSPQKQDRNCQTKINIWS